MLINYVKSRESRSLCTSKPHPRFIVAMCTILIITKGESGDVLTELKARRYSIRRCSDVLTEGN